MAKVIFTSGDTFSFENGFGLALSETQGLLIMGEGGRIARKIQKGVIPKDSLPRDAKLLPYEIQFAFDAVKCVMT